MFENLIYNALRATTANGSITVGAQNEGEYVRIFVYEKTIGTPTDTHGGDYYAVIAE